MTSRRSILIFPFVVLSLFAAALFTPTASAQPSGMGECYLVCDPYFSSCDEECYECAYDSECAIWWLSTCGDESYACVDGSCTPNWGESARNNVGTYDGRAFFFCNHHRVDEVTMTDFNECNVNPAFNSYTYCDDWIDDYKNGCCYPSCCEGVGENYTQLSCNDVHTCS